MAIFPALQKLTHMRFEQNNVNISIDNSPQMRFTQNIFNIKSPKGDCHLVLQLLEGTSQSWSLLYRLLCE